MKDILPTVTKHLVYVQKVRIDKIGTAQLDFGGTGTSSRDIPNIYFKVAVISLACRSLTVDFLAS